MKDAITQISDFVFDVCGRGFDQVLGTPPRWMFLGRASRAGPADETGVSPLSGNNSNHRRAGGKCVDARDGIKVWLDEQR